MPLTRGTIGRMTAMCVEHEPLFWIGVAAMALGTAGVAYLVSTALSRAVLSRVHQVLEP